MDLEGILKETPCFIAACGVSEINIMKHYATLGLIIFPIFIVSNPRVSMLSWYENIY